MKNTTNNYRKPNPIIYGIFTFMSIILSWLKFNLKIEKNELKGVKGPYVVIANHESALDFVNVARAIKKRAHFVISNAFYNTFPFRFIVERVGLIPKNQFQTMPSDLKKMKTAVDNELPLVIFPAGLMPENGICTPIPKATGKALKWLNQDVYLAKSNGSYLTNPKWSSKWRRGKTTLNVEKFIAKEDLDKYTAEEIQEMVEKALYFDAYKNNGLEKIPFKNGDNVVGLENVLYKCPLCGKEYTIISEDKTALKCMSCGYKVYSDKTGALYRDKGKEAIFKYPSDWSLYIEKEIEKKIDKNPSYKLECLADVFILDEKKHKFVKGGTARVTLNKDGFILNGMVDGEKLDKEYSIKNYPSLPLKPGKSFEIQDGKTILRICPIVPKVCTEWVSTAEIFYKKSLL